MLTQSITLLQIIVFALFYIFGWGAGRVYERRRSRLVEEAMTKQVRDLQQVVINLQNTMNRISNEDFNDHD